MTFLKKIFLIDGIGALASAFLLGVVLVRFEAHFGIPKSTLYVLAGISCIFALYDFYCFLKVKESLAKYLKWIATANLLYCCLSIGFAFYHSSEIKSLGWAYMIGEVAIVVALALYELKTANNK
jgi:hypothetical protein